MEFLKRHWKSRTLILLILGVVVSLAMWRLELTNWATDMNSLAAQQGAAGGEPQKTPPAGLIYILPFVKYLVFTLVPASIVVGVRALFRRLTRKAA